MRALPRVKGNTVQCAAPQLQQACGSANVDRTDTKKIRYLYIQIYKSSETRGVWYAGEAERAEVTKHLLYLSAETDLTQVS